MDLGQSRRRPGGMNIWTKQIPGHLILARTRNFTGFRTPRRPCSWSWKLAVGPVEGFANEKIESYCGRGGIVFDWVAVDGDVIMRTGTIFRWIMVDRDVMSEAVIVGKESFVNVVALGSFSWIAVKPRQGCGVWSFWKRIPERIS